MDVSGCIHGFLFHIACLVQFNWSSKNIPKIFMWFFGFNNISLPSSFILIFIMFTWALLVFMTRTSVLPMLFFILLRLFGALATMMCSEETDSLGPGYYVYSNIIFSGFFYTFAWIFETPCELELHISEYFHVVYSITWCMPLNGSTLSIDTITKYTATYITLASHLAICYCVIFIY